MNISGVGEMGVGETGVGEMGQIIGETGVGEMGVGETGTSHVIIYPFVYVYVQLHIINPSGLIMASRVNTAGDNQTAQVQNL